MRRMTPNSGLTRLSFNRVTNALFKGVPSEQVTHMVEGPRIRTRIDDYHGRILWLFGSNDFKIARVSRHFARDCSVFLDIGANYSTIGFGVALDPQVRCQVHLFEPQPYLVDYVEEAIRDAGLTEQIHMHPLALFNAEGSFKMAIPGHHSGLATLVMEERFEDGVKTIDVPTVVTEDYVRPLVGDQPFGVKIDIEGAEKDVLPGLFAQANMRFCVFEGANTEPEIVEAFSNAGFKVFGVCRTIFSVKLFPVGQSASYTDYHDLVAVRTARTDWPDRQMTPAEVSGLARG